MRTDDGMDGAPLYRLVYESGNGELSADTAVGHVTGVLVYREDAKTNPSEFNDFGDAYTPIYKDIGKFIGTLTKDQPAGRNDWFP